MASLTRTNEYKEYNEYISNKITDKIINEMKEDKEDKKMITFGERIDLRKDFVHNKVK